MGFEWLGEERGLGKKRIDRPQAGDAVFAERFSGGSQPYDGRGPPHGWQRCSSRRWSRSAENFGSPERMARDSRKNYNSPPRLALNQWGLGGSWNIGAESGRLESAPGKIVFRFHARDVHMVLGLEKNGTPVRFKVKLNGATPGDDHGVDSAADGSGEVRESRMYQLIRQKGAIKDVIFEIEFLEPGVEAFSLTFG